MRPRSQRFSLLKRCGLAKLRSNQLSHEATHNKALERIECASRCGCRFLVTAQLSRYTASAAGKVVCRNYPPESRFQGVFISTTFCG